MKHTQIRLKSIRAVMVHNESYLDIFDTKIRSDLHDGFRLIDAREFRLNLAAAWNMGW